VQVLRGPRQEASRFLDRVPGHEHDAVVAILSRCPVLELRQGARPAIPRDAEVIVVERGAVLLAAGPRLSRRTIVLGIAGPGALLLPPRRGESLGALDSAAVRIVGPAPRGRLLGLPGAARALADGLGETLRDRQESLAIMSWRLHSDRLREKLLRLARAHGRVVRGGVRIDLPLTHQLLADMIGSARETVTIELRGLRRAGFVVREGRSYILNVPPGQLEP
jgi:hypothetical protein